MCLCEVRRKQLTFVSEFTKISFHFDRTCALFRQMVAIYIFCHIIIFSYFIQKIQKIYCDSFYGLYMWCCKEQWFAKCISKSCIICYIQIIRRWLSHILILFPIFSAPWQFLSMSWQFLSYPHNFCRCPDIFVDGLTISSRSVSFS